MRKTFGIVAGLGFYASAAFAEPLSGLRDVVLHSGDGATIKVAQIMFEPSGDAAQYSIEWNDAVFTDHFLSMRPFKCLEGAEKLWCRVAYPYAIARRAHYGDLTDLEYDLMFVWKNEGEYGIDLWNGVYYDIAPSGDILVGTMNDFDMNIIASPPEDGNLRPIEIGDLEEADADSHWLPRLTIE